MTTKKRLLFISHRIPFPPNKGDKIRSYNILRHLGQHYEIFLAFMIDDKNDLERIQKLRPMAQDIFFDLIHPRWKKLRSSTALLTSQPLTVPYFYSNTLQRSMDNLLNRQSMDHVFCFSSATAEYVFRSEHYGGTLRRARWTMDFIDVDSHKWRQYAETRKFPMRWLYNREATYLSGYEKRIAEEFDHLLLVSQAEKDLLHESIASRNVHVVGNGVNLAFFSPDHQSRLHTDTPAMVFTGAMDYWPNIDGMKWFVNDILPLVVREIPKVTLYVVGNRPSPEIQRFNNQKEVVVTGFVEDVRDYLSAADVCLVPLRIARGIQNKVLEAMAMGKAVVSTPQAHQGIQATPGQDLIVAEDEKSFAHAIVQLISNKHDRERIGRRARLCMEKSYSWKTNLEKLTHLLAH